MANAEHIDIVKQGCDAIKTYLETHQDAMFDLSGADLSWLDLNNMDLRGAILRNANLSGASLRGANLRSADLRWAILNGANLSRAKLGMANLSHASLRDAYLSHTNLTKANLENADLRNANGSETILSGVVLTGAKVHNLKADKWDTSALKCEWLNLAPDGIDTPAPEWTWKPDQNQPSPFDDPNFDRLVLELNIDSSFLTLEAFAKAFSYIAERFETIIPEPGLEWTRLQRIDNHIEWTLTGPEASLTALSRLLEAAVRSKRSVENKALVENTQSLSFNAEQTAHAEAFIKQLNLSQHPQVTTAILHIAQFTQSISCRGETFRLKQMQSLPTSQGDKRPHDSMEEYDQTITLQNKSNPHYDSILKKFKEQFSDKLS